MGIEYEGIKLTDIYNKANPNKISQKFGKSLIMSLAVTHEGDPSIIRKIRLNQDFKPPETLQDEDLEEEKLLDEQKLFQTLHENLVEL